MNTVSGVRHYDHFNNHSHWMAIGVLVEVLPPGGGAGAEGGTVGKPPPKEEKGLKNWVRNKLKALASLLGRLGPKAAEALQR